MRKTFRKQQEESQIIWKNASHEAKFDPNKLTTYYAFVEIDGKELVIKYDGRFRSEARAYFEEISRMHGNGKFNGKLHVLKK